MTVPILAAPSGDNPASGREGELARLSRRRCIIFLSVGLPRHPWA